MGKVDDPKISKAIIRDPEQAGTQVERKRQLARRRERKGKPISGADKPSARRAETRK